MKSHNHLPFRTPLLLSAAGLLSLVMATLAQPALPVIDPNTIINITNFGASTSLTNTTFIQNAINAASTTNGGIGATVEIPAGTYLSGPLTMMSKVNLQIDGGATLQMLPFMTYTNLFGTTDFIFGNNLSDIEISGSGTIDGQGSDWWTAFNHNNSLARPNFINFKHSHRILIQNVTLINAPTFHLMLKNSNGNVTIQGITINASGFSPNTDGMDIGSTNMLIQNCNISDGDDNIEIGSSGSAVAANIVITNCQFGTGHGVSLGSIVSAGVSNVMVIDCGYNNTDYGIRMKSDNDVGGTVQNMSYYNLKMTNLTYAPIVIYSYYNKYGTPTTSKITPSVAAATNAATVISSTPIWRNIIISNLTATSAQPGMIWARTEMPATNIFLSKLNITASGSAQNFDLYHVKQVQIVDSQFINTKANNTNFWLFDAEVTFSNATSSTGYISLYGITTNSFGNNLAFYNSPGVLSFTNLIDDGPLTLADSILTISNNFTLFPTTVLNYTVDPNPNRVAVVGNLALGGTINVTTNASGFGAVTNTLLTYTGTLSGSPSLGSTPGSPYNYSLDTSVAGQVNLIVTLPAPPAPTNFMALGTNLLINLNWNAVPGTTSYNLKRGIVNGGPYPTVYSGLTATNYPDAAVTNAVTYYYVVTAVSVLGGESTNSLQASATPLPSSMPTNIDAQVSSGQLQLSWPQDHLGWLLQIQTNSLDSGLGNNWVSVPNSTTFNQYFLPINPTNGAVFLRLVYPY